MSRKLNLNPSTCYFLGLYNCFREGKAIGINTASEEIMTRFVKTAVKDFEIEPNRVLVEQEYEEHKVHFYNSKLKKLLENALDTRERLFKYKNEYSGNYFAALYDMKGGKDPRGIFFKGLEKLDESVLEHINFHTETRGSKTYIINGGTFLTFIKRFSATVR